MRRGSSLGRHRLCGCTRSASRTPGIGRARHLCESIPTAESGTRSVGTETNDRTSSGLTGCASAYLRQYRAIDCTRNHYLLGRGAAGRDQAPAREIRRPSILRPQSLAEAGRVWFLEHSQTAVARVLTSRSRRPIPHPSCFQKASHLRAGAAHRIPPVGETRC